MTSWTLALRRFLAVIPLAVLAAVPARPSAEEKQPASDPMAGWTPPKVKNEKKDRQEIHQVFMKMDQAGKKGDLAAAAALIDFPVLMVTDDKKGEAHAASWDQAAWEKAMAPFYSRPMPGGMTHAPNVTLLTDSLAVVSDRWTMAMHGKKVSGRSAMVLVRKDGQWKTKSMIEGGWGDMAEASAAPGGTGGAKP